MPLYRPSELIAFLESLGIKPKKSLSQNFLIDGNIVRKIISAAKIAEGEKVLEIGPGVGVLTEALVLAKASVIAIEKDPILAKSLKKRFPQVEVIEGDVLDFDFTSVKKCKVVANLPYGIATKIITKLLENFSHITNCILMLQKEVAMRCCAKKSTSDYSSFTLFVNFFSHPKLLFDVPSSCFYPKPRVKSTIIELDLKEPSKNIDQKSFFSFVRKIFQQRRKMLTTTLPKIKEVLISLNLNPQARAEELSLDELILLKKGFDAMP